MGFIYFSYGMTKSASSFIYQIQERIFELSQYELVKIPSSIRGNKARENYVEPITDNTITAILDWLPSNSVTVIKTHGAPSRLAIDLINEGRAFASATYRDPRDIAVSLVDHGRRSRNQGLSDFAEFLKPLDALPEIQRQINRLSSWTNLDRCQSFAFERIRQSPQEIIGEIIDQTRLNSINKDAVISHFYDKNSIIHYNIGRSERYKDIMTAQEIQKFNEAFGNFISFCSASAEG